MPTPKYVCDYCNKQFHDTPASRKRHMQGMMHQRAVKAWYDQFREQDGNRRTGVCAYFHRTGTCHYGSNCMYSHVTPPGFSYGGPRMTDPNTSNTSTMGPSLTDAAQGATLPAPLSVPESKLPPSLQPPPEEGYPPMPFIDWG